MRGDSELQGSSWILTRPADRAEVWARFLEDHGARVHCDPVLQLSPVLEPIDWTPVESTALWVFSSATTVRHFFSRLPEASVSWGEGASQPLFAAVGKATAEAIREAGHEVTFLGPGTGAVDLVTLILDGRHGARGDPVDGLGRRRELLCWWAALPFAGEATAGASAA